MAEFYSLGICFIYSMLGNKNIPTFQCCSPTYGEASVVKPHYQTNSGLRQIKLDGKRRSLNSIFLNPHAFGVW